jgi:ATP-binding protein involved in chromosome partitioning
MTSYIPTVIRRSDPRRIEIEWSDGGRTTYSPAQLRGLCPCAQCVNEISGKRMNDPASVPSELEQSGLHMIGNYAISMHFSDGHHTGIYTFKYLRENDPELNEDLRAASPPAGQPRRRDDPGAGGRDPGRTSHSG